jgi:hypothetical protein
MHEIENRIRHMSAGWPTGDTPAGVVSDPIVAPPRRYSRTLKRLCPLNLRNVRHVS